MTGARRRPASLPSRDESLRLLRESGCDEQVVAHCEAVASLAVKIARRCGADVALVETGALLHDLGRSRTQAIAHAVEGAKIAREHGLPGELVSTIERHIGAGISRDEARRLGLPEKDYVPETLEEKIVCHSDNLVSGTERAGVREAISRLVREGHTEAAKRMLELHRELSSICGIDLDEIR